MMIATFRYASLVGTPPFCSSAKHHRDPNQPATAPSHRCSSVAQGHLPRLGPRPRIQVEPSPTTPAGYEDRQRPPGDCAAHHRLRLPPKSALLSWVSGRDCLRSDGESDSSMLLQLLATRNAAAAIAHCTPWSTCRRLYWRVRGSDVALQSRTRTGPG